MDINKNAAMRTTRTELRARAELQPGDIFWFSGYWCTFVRFGADGRGYARFPYTPADREVWMFHGEDPASDYSKKWGPHMVTIRLSTEARPPDDRGDGQPSGLALACAELGMTLSDEERARLRARADAAPPQGSTLAKLRAGRKL